MPHIASYSHVPIGIAGGEGCYVFDKKGKKALDLIGGWCVATVGWKHPEMTVAIARQAEEGMYAPPFFQPSDREEALAERLCTLAPGHLTRVFRSTGGSEAVDYALMCLRAASGKPTIVSIDGVYHGHTYGAAAVGDACTKKMAPCPEGFIKLPMPKTPEEGREVAAQFEKLVIERKDVAAFFSEPFWTNAGCHLPPEGLYAEIQRICRKHGVLLAMDEVATGMGRSGRMYASELFGLEPDVICLGKSFTGGYSSMAATLVTEDVYKKSRGIPDYCTFGWMAQDLVAAEKNLELIERDGLAKNAAEVGAYFLELLKPLEKLARVKQVRGQGMVFAVEFHLPIAPVVALACFRHGAVVAFSDANTLFFSPPLALSREQAKEGADIIRKACGAKV